MLIKQWLRQYQNIHSFNQIVSYFTRVTATSKTTVDLVFTNNHLISAVVSKNNEIADHKMLILTKRNKSCEYQTNQIIDRKRLKSPEYEELLLTKINNTCMNTGVVNVFASQITEFIDSSACELGSEKTINLTYSRRWFNDELKLMREQRNQAERLAEFTNDPQH